MTVTVSQLLSKGSHPSTVFTIASSTSRNKNKADYICDGVADNVQFQAAIDALPTNGGKIVLLEGTFNLNAAVSIRGDLWIDGQGATASIISYQSSGNFNMFQYSATTNQAACVITNIRANGGGTGTTGKFIDSKTSTGELWDVHLVNVFLWNFGTSPAVDINPVWGFRADRLIIEGGFGTGINLDSDGSSQNSGAIINRCKIKVGDAAGNCDAIVLNNSALCLIQGNELGAGTNKYGIQIIDSDQNCIIGNTFLGGGNDDGNGILIDGTSDGNQIIGNMLNGGSVGGTAITINAGALENAIIGNGFLLWTTEITDNGANTVKFGNSSGLIAATRQTALPYTLSVQGATTLNDSGGQNNTIIESDNNAVLFGVDAAGDRVVIGDGGSTNYAQFGTGGDLTFNGTADYLIAANRYAFRYSATENIGFYFNGNSSSLDVKDSSANSTVQLGLDGTITHTGKTIHTNSALQTIDAVGDAILANAHLVALDPNGDYTLTSTPTIADGTIGQELLIICANGEANTVTVQDQDTLGSSNLQLGAATRAITGKKVLHLMFDGSDWIEISYGNN